jgi:hypothetical protein
MIAHVRPTIKRELYSNPLRALLLVHYNTQLVLENRYILMVCFCIPIISHSLSLFIGINMFCLVYLSGVIVPQFARQLQSVGVSNSFLSGVAKQFLSPPFTHSSPNTRYSYIHTC